MSTKKSRAHQKAVIEIIPEDEESDEMRQLRRIQAPIEWSKLPPGFVIQDMTVDQFPVALQLLKDHYLNTDVMCAKSDVLEDPASVDDIIKRTESLLFDKCSIVAIHEETQEVAGILVLRMFEKSDHGRVLSRIKITAGDKFKKIRRVSAYLNRKVDLYSLFNVEQYLRYYYVAVAPKFRKQGPALPSIGVGLSMMRCAVGVARSFYVPLVMGLFGNASLQNKGKRIGMKVIDEVFYVDWVENNEMVFDDPGPGNYTIALMAGEVILPTVEPETKLE